MKRETKREKYERLALLSVIFPHKMTEEDWKTLKKLEKEMKGTKK